MEYQVVIGLEIHVQLLTLSKAFCGDNAEYGGMPNTHVSAISLGHPGTLPMHNKVAVDHAIKVGLALNCNIREFNEYARKNYFYADLPKGYQITQDKTPICTGGHVTIRTKDGVEKNVNLTRIHMEEDSGKSMHDQDLTDSLIDYNRAGVALIEIVSEPEMRSAEEAFQFVTEIRKLVRYLGICDGNMEEGSLRCDANISVMPVGSTTFGTKVEVKNMNSITNVRRAIEFETERQIALCEKGETFPSETRSFNALKGITISLRNKELANDYRYFPEPDLPPLVLSEHYIKKIKEEMPALPAELFARLKNELSLTDYDAQVITEDRPTAEYFLEIIKHTSNFKSAANWMMGAIRSYLNEKAIDISAFNKKVAPQKIAALIALIDEGKLSHTAAAQQVFPALAEDSAKEPLEVAESLNIIQSGDESLIDSIVEEALSKFPDKIEEYRSGKKGLLGLFVGEAMKLSKGKADPKKVNEAVTKKLG
ncbi:MAG: Asp-tRNA(Asn)/Glu-tRNA(Gln) amidotransferase subunit GatB [Bacteroidia bacterium]|nr:Asp-tRNA(Asn)/Glu-tRNA(Gln) amidotransferase subunit GatB [Bacteroidia bacterium]